ncbi:MAG TPA: HK97-gp10 family putative phage morphogenesis protein [Ktedonosporobacter sp.]|nr:HK97-gp10 family putative phage morphogenesis protein [Ktedonosporobacter sp.]
MSAFGVIWSGLENLISSLTQVREQTPHSISQIYADVGAEALDLMNSLTPVRTGRLKAANTLTLDEMSATLSNDTPYCVFVEFGTRHMAPQPFFTPALEFMDQQLQQRLPEAFNT